MGVPSHGLKRGVTRHGPGIVTTLVGITQHACKDFVLSVTAAELHHRGEQRTQPGGGCHPRSTCKVPDRAHRRQGDACHLSCVGTTASTALYCHSMCECPLQVTGCVECNGRLYVEQAPKPRNAVRCPEIRQSLPAIPGIHTIELQPPKQRSCVSRVAKRNRRRRQQMTIENLQGLRPIARVLLEHGQVPCIVTAHAAATDPIRLLLAQPACAARMLPELEERVGGSVNRSREIRIDRQRSPCQLESLAGISILCAGECSHRENVVKSRHLLSP